MLKQLEYNVSLRLDQNVITYAVDWQVKIDNLK